MLDWIKRVFCIFGHIAQFIHPHHALDLIEQPLEKPKVPARDANDGEVASASMKSQIARMLVPKTRVCSVNHQSQFAPINSRSVWASIEKSYYPTNTWRVGTVSDSRR